MLIAHGFPRLWWESDRRLRPSDCRSLPAHVRAQIIRLCRPDDCDCSGGFTSLAAGLPAFVFGGGLSRGLGLRRPGPGAAWTLGVLVPRPTGRRQEPAVT